MSILPINNKIDATVTNEHPPHGLKQTFTFNGGTVLFENGHIIEMKFFNSIIVFHDNIRIYSCDYDGNGRKHGIEQENDDYIWAINWVHGVATEITVNANLSKSKLPKELLPTCLYTKNDEHFDN